ncbi:MAG TPA: hypothetical protein VGZ47_21915, partial [Gemmataceae bacterium]|nr:hypothetical protein [Gemmataceae bacterium]
MKRACTMLALTGIVALIGCKKDSTSGSGTTPQGGTFSSATTGTNPTLQAAYDNVARAMERVIQLLSGVKDDASA